jgi:CHASE2 domain-containing sensor protein
VDHRPQYWFAARRDGRGWGWPLTWHGWLVYAAWFATLFVIFPYLRVPERPLFALAVIMVMVIPLAIICYWKGEPLRWHRGG